MICLSLLARASATGPRLAAGLALCEGRLTYVGAYHLIDPRAQAQVILERRPVDPSLLVEFFARHPALASLEVERLFDQSVGVAEGYTLREHTRMYLTNVRAELKHYDVPGWVTSLALFAAVFHDVGKPIVREEFVATFGREPRPDELRRLSLRQLDHTLPLLRRIGEALRFTEREITLIAELVRDDVVGAVVNGRLPPAAAALRLADEAHRFGVTPRVMFGLRTLTYVSDAGAYACLRFGSVERGLSPVLVDDARGRLVPAAAAYWALAGLIGADPRLDPGATSGPPRAPNGGVP